MNQRPYGSWNSPFRAEQLASAFVSFSQPSVDQGTVYWLEARPVEAGRQVVMSARHALHESAPKRTECTPESMNVRTLVHEYGGGDYAVRKGQLYFVNFSDQRIYRVESGGVRPISPAGARYADFELSADERWLFAVEETSREGREPENKLVAFELAPPDQLLSPQAPRVIASGYDFYSSPVLSPQGDRLAFLAWRHPDMPWDDTTLFVMGWSADGPRGEPRPVVEHEGESIFQPSFSPEGKLTFVSDRSGWWNLYQLREGGVRALCPLDQEFGVPQWVFGLSRYAFVSEEEILCAFGRSGGMQLASLRVESGQLRDLALPYQDFAGIRVSEDLACFVGLRPDRAPAIVVMEPSTGNWREVVSSASDDRDLDSVVIPEAIDFESVEGRRAHAWFYSPARSDVSAPRGERPPLLVKSHGGPTGASSASLDLRIQYWVSRGIAVVDVDYGGSTGYGRSYRNALRGQWGVVDVEDCVQAALSLAAAGRVDSERLAISGGSAGGFTTLCALTFHDSFRAGASHYGIGDLEALARDTHKFEARYLDRLIGPYPEARELYRSRSPIHFTEQLSCPVVFFQGLEDKVVPPGQAEAMVAALAKQGIPHAYVPFEGEQHGFRRAESIRSALEGELYFYGQIFGFEVDVPPGRVMIAN